jgi:hypothetical protein
VGALYRHPSELGFRQSSECLIPDLEAESKEAKFNARLNRDGYFFVG